MPSMFEQIGSGLKGLISGQLGSNMYDIDAQKRPEMISKNFPSVAPQSRQLGKALPTQPGSLAGLIRGNKPYVNTSLATTQQPKTVDQLHQDHIVANQGVVDATAKAIADAKKGQAEAQKQFDIAHPGNGSSAIQTAGSTSTIEPKKYLDDNGNPTPTNPTTPPVKSDAFNTNIQNLTNYGSGQESPEVAKARQDLQDLENERMKKHMNIQGTAGFLTQANGEEGLLNQQYLTAKDAATQALNSALTSQGQQIGAAGQAGGLAQPIQVSPGTSVVNPQTMKEGFSGIGGLTGLGIAQQNIKQGQQYTQQASDLGVSLEGLSKVSGFADDFIKNSDLNKSSSPFFNKQQNTTLGQLKSSDIGTYNELVNQIQTYATQILSSTGMGVDQASSLASNINPDGMTASELKAFLGNLDKLGQARKAVLETAAKGSLSSGTTPYTGTTNESGSLQSTGGGGTPVIPSDNDALQAIAGGAANFGGDILAIGGAIKSFLGF